MAQTSQFATALIDETVQTFNGNVASVSPQDGISLIDNWIHALRSGDASTNPIASTLNDLKLELQSGNPKSDRITETLNQLVSQTQQASRTTDGAQQSALNELAGALQGFGEQLSGQQGNPDQPGNQAAATSGVSSHARSPQEGQQQQAADSSYGQTGDAGNTQGEGSYGSGYGQK